MFLFEPASKQSDAAAKRIVQLEQLVERLPMALDIQKSLNLLELTPMEHREMVEALRTDFSVRQICETLGFNRSNLYYPPKQPPCEAGLRDEIEKLSLLYPTYGYRRPTQLLVVADIPSDISVLPD